MKIIHVCTSYEQYNILGVADNDKDVKSIIRQYVRECYRNEKDYMDLFERPSSYILVAMRRCVNIWNSITVQEITLNEFSDIVIPL